jgi:hypothetical protein
MEVRTYTTRMNGRNKVSCCMNIEARFFFRKKSTNSTLYLYVNAFTSTCPFLSPHSEAKQQQRAPVPAPMAMALAILFFCVLVLSSAAIAFLLIRHCLAADPEQQAPRRLAAAVAPPEPEEHDEQLPSLPLEKEKDTLEPPRRLTWREVEALTGGFDEAAVVGRGGSSTVYLARLRHGAPVAVKVQRWCGGERRLRAFRQELDLLRRLHHPHIVALLAYSDDHGTCFLFQALIYSDFPSPHPHPR